MQTRILATAFALIAAGAAWAAEPQSKPAAAPAQPAMDMKAMEEMMTRAAMPGAEHQWLAGMAGDWALTVKATMDPTQPPQVSQGTATAKMVLGGRFLLEEVTGDMMGQPFHGMGLTGYDNVLKKYVGSWLDTMGTGIMTSTGSYDTGAKTMTCTAQYPDPMTGKMASYRLVSRFPSSDEHVFTMFGAGPDGKEMQMLEITYRRKQ